MSNSFFTGSKMVKELKPSDFSKNHPSQLKTKECTPILFYAPWCPWCVKVKDDWMQFGKKATFLNVSAFDCEKHGDHYQKIKTDLPHLVKGFPSMVVFKDGEATEAIGTGENSRSVQNFIKDGMRICQH